MQTLKRQLGARDIDLDSEGGWVRFHLYGDQPLDLAGLPHLMERASYTLRGIEVETSGTLVEDNGANGGGKLVLKVGATGEVLPVRLGNLPHTKGWVTVRAKVEEWETGAPVLVVTKLTVATASSS